MWCRNFWKRIASFSFTFALGLLLANFFFQNKLPNQIIEQKTVSIEKKGETIERKNCISVAPSIKESDKNNLLYQLYAKRIKNKAEIKYWLLQNIDAPQKAKENRRSELKAIEQKIATLKEIIDSFRENDRVNQNLLYLEKCYEF